MQIDILIKIAGLGLLVSVITNLLKQSGREELSALVVVVGLAIGTYLMLETVSSLVETIRRVFSLVLKGGQPWTWCRCWGWAS